MNLADNGFYFKPTVVALAMAIAAGFYEETIFRGVTVPIGMRYFKSEKRVGILVLISALVFGLMHIGNIMNGASIQRCEHTDGNRSGRRYDLRRNIFHCCISQDRKHTDSDLHARHI